MRVPRRDAAGGELRVAAGPGIRQVLADARVDRLVAVFGSLAEAAGRRPAAGLSYGPVGALVASWSAPALVISYELRRAGQPPGR